MPYPKDPTALKLIKGNPSKTKLPAGEPKPEVVIPDPPEHLSPEAKVEWVRVTQYLYNLNLISDLDRAVLAAYCQAYGRWVQAEEILAKMAEKDTATKGLIIKTTTGNVVNNPYLGIANRAMINMADMAREFGMTPVARTRVNADIIHDPKDKASKYFTS